MPNRVCCIILISTPPIEKVCVKYVRVLIVKTIAIHKRPYVGSSTAEGSPYRPIISN